MIIKIGIDFKKILAFFAVAGFLTAGSTLGWTLDQTDFQKLTEPVQEQIFNSFSDVPLYYLESPPGSRFVDTLPVEKRKVIRFFLDPQAAEAFRIENEKSSGKTGFLKKIPMASILKTIYSQSKLKNLALKSGPELLISAGEGSREVSFYTLTETKSGKPYSLEFRKKKIIPAFVSMESAESLVKIITNSSSQTLRMEVLNLEKFINFLKLQQTSDIGIPVRVCPYASWPKYTAIRPMTWGVGSSYLFGTFLVLFLFWAITQKPKRK